MTAAAGPAVGRVAVVGGGTMGRDIAWLHLAAGHAVVLREADAGRLDAAVAAVRGYAARRVARGESTAADAAATLARLVPTLDAAPIAGADLVIEAVVERLEVKRAVFAELAGVVGPDALLASNTSTLPIAGLADAVRDAGGDPGRVLGLHFFSPARVMRLVEVVRAPSTAPAALDRAVSHVRAIGRVPVVVGDCQGFVSNRLSMAYAAESAALVAAGTSPYAVDAALAAFGMPMGPFTMLDLAGLDVYALTVPGMVRAYGDRARPSPLVDRLVALGRLGQKAGRGVYAYDAAAPRGRPDPEVDALAAALRAPDAAPPDAPSADAPADAEIVARVLLATANEGARCLADGVAASADDVDTVMALGFGFPAAAGGPLRWVAETLGWPAAVAALEALAAADRDPADRARHAPADWLRARAAG